MRQRKAFTLVELLVVIGIIGVLISILLPALNKARAQAARVKCESNMRNIAMAAITYGAENKAQMPFCNWGDPGQTAYTKANTGGVYGFGWLYAYQDKRVGYGAPIDGPWATPYPTLGIKTGVLWPYLKQAAIYRCPSDTETGIWTGTEWLTSYLMSGAECAFGGNNTNDTLTYLKRTPGFRFTQFRRSADCVMFWEVMEQKTNGVSNTGTLWNDGSSYPDEEVLADRHNLGANVSFVDGHVEWWDPGTWYYESQKATGPYKSVAPPGPTKLWCNPITNDGRQS